MIMNSKHTIRKMVRGPASLPSVVKQRSEAKLFLLVTVSSFFASRVGEGGSSMRSSKAIGAQSLISPTQFASIASSCSDEELHVRSLGSVRDTSGRLSLSNGSISKVWIISLAPPTPDITCHVSAALVPPT